MLPLILEYAEQPLLSDDDFAASLSYSETLNLTVLKGTSEPAITLSRLATETFTKTMHEDSDTDRNPQLDNCRRYLDTATETRTHNEVSDSDPGYHALLARLATMTLTLTHESSDTD
ncbi:hypothetical protein LRS06_23145 [Hymenobacter sp. J193]|uniref:hypothetical protein n=1 Tax=Hymenobacter sp. J193 TaxID=2898429 RepID=UPI0021519FE2|nr:hypothetical protein [Hymenobacter sp. J193]MCR5890533.1 hypothetical protein [Hymenobacter sp. J193]MCR5890628.1 hypothetical protein [Hymenobacter sp. J193]